jgi:uncharacterized protein involved in type VI secretion and phage assembly
MSPERIFHGKFRGKVTHNDDSDGLGRIQATVLEVYGSKDSPWALPSVPYAGDNVGLMLIPPVGAWVWFEFEHGNPDVPIWTGCFWEKGQTRPFPKATATTKILKTDSVTITIDDTNSGQGSITIKTAANASLTIKGNSITVVNTDQTPAAKVELSGGTVNINGNSLEVS